MCPPTRPQLPSHSPYACSTCDGAWLRAAAPHMFFTLWMSVSHCSSKVNTILCLVRHQCMRREGQVCCAFLGGEAVVSWPGSVKGKGNSETCWEKKAQGQARWPHNSQIKFSSRPPFTLGDRESTLFLLKDTHPSLYVNLFYTSLRKVWEL